MMVSIRRALVDCVVLSVQDSPVFYPCCKRCFSKIDVEQRDRCRCFKCGSSCTADLLGHRYRLSLRVARDGCMFGLTVFGTCLNPFFGIDASGLQRLVINRGDPVGTATRSAVLLKAVQDCFIGRHFIFEIKLNATEPQPWIKSAVQNGSGNNSKVQVVASQMHHPKALGLEGCTVIRYYQSLLQKAVESELGGADLIKNPRLLPLSLLMNPHCSPQSSFSDGAPRSSGCFSNSTPSSQHSDSSFSPTPPWQQSLGLVTSSAEQEDNGPNQNSEDEDERDADRFDSSYRIKGDSPKDHEESEETAVSLLKKEVTLLSQWTVVGPWSPGHSSRAKRLSTKDLPETSMSSSVAWEDLPFSESLTEFLCERQGCDVTEPERNAYNKRETPRIRPQDQILSIHSSPASASDPSWVLMGQHPPNTPAVKEADGLGCSKHVCDNHVTSVNNSHAKNTSSDGCNHKKEEHSEVDVYNCSADLFSNSVTDTPNRTVSSIIKTRLLVLDKRRSSETMTLSGVTPSKHKLMQKRNNIRNSLLPPDTPQLDFMPPSQSTPIVRAGSPASSRCSTSVGLNSLPDSLESSDLESHTTAEISLSLCKFYPLVHSEPSKTMYNSRSNKSALKQRIRKEEMTKRHLLPLQHRKVQRAAPDIAPSEKVTNKWNTSSCDVIACEGMNEMLIPPTPLTKTQPSRTHRKQSQAENGSPSSDRVWEEEQEDGVNCGGTARNQTFTSLCAQLQTRNQNSEAVMEGILGTSHRSLLDESKECDWSRDLFSDSV